jgi:hypothetical protein
MEAAGEGETLTVAPGSGKASPGVIRLGLPL